MKSIKSDNSIISEGRKNYRKTPEYLRKVNKMKYEINQKYLDLIRNEKSILRKLLLILKKKIEINREINYIGGYSNLYGKTK